MEADAGRRTPQQIPIRRSYRRRGYLHRTWLTTTRLTPTHKTIRAGHSNEQEAAIRNSKEAYSPRNSKVNTIPPVSRLNPLISSLSPSAKSIGARFDSAKTHTAHPLTNNLHNPKPPIRTNDPPNTSKPRRERAIATSYLILCEEARTPPRTLNAAADKVPTVNRAYTRRPRTPKKPKPPRRLGLKPVEESGKVHPTRASVKSPKATKTIVVALPGPLSSLRINLTPSKGGCPTPIQPAFVGPTRLCLSPKVLRSNKVKKKRPQQELD